MTLMMLQHILTWYSLFFLIKPFSFLWWVGVVRGLWCGEDRKIFLSPPPNTSNIFLGGVGGVFYLYLSISLSSFYPFLSLLSLTFFFWFLMFSLCLLYSQFSLSLLFVPLLPKGWGMPPRGEDAVLNGGVEVMIITEFLRPGKSTCTRS